MIFKSFLTVLEGEANRKPVDQPEFEPFAETARAQLCQDFTRSRELGPPHEFVEGLIKQLDATAALRKAKETELARGMQELSLLQRQKTFAKVPRGLASKYSKAKIAIRYQRWDCESYQYLKEKTDIALQCTKTKVQQLERQILQIERRLTESTDDLRAVSSALGQELSQLYLIEDRESRLHREHRSLMEARQNEHRQLTEVKGQAEAHFIRKQYAVQGSRKKFRLLNERVAELKAKRSSILMHKVVSILMLSHIKRQQTKLTSTFTSCLPEVVISKFEEYSSHEESLKNAIDDKVNSLSTLQTRKSSFIYALQSARDAMILNSAKAQIIVKSKQDILVKTEVLRQKAADSHLMILRDRAKASSDLSFKALCVLQALLQKIDMHDSTELLGPRMELVAELPPSFGEMELHILFSLLIKKLSMADCISHQWIVMSRQLQLHKHLSIRQRGHDLLRVRTLIGPNLLQSPSSRRPNDCKSGFRGLAERTSRDLSRTPLEKRKSISKLTANSKLMDISSDADSVELDRKQLKLDLKKPRVPPLKIKSLGNSPLATSRTANWEERALRQLVQLDKSRAALSSRTRGLSKPTSPQPRDITRQLKQQLRKVANCRLQTAVARPRKMHSPKLTQR